MKTGLVLAMLLAVLTGIAHSVLGERYILTRLFRRENLPKLFGSDWFTKRTLRFAWHLTTIAWWGLGAVLWVLAGDGPAEEAAILKVIAVTFLGSAAVTAFASRGRHLAWPVFLAIGVLAWLAA